MTTQILQFKLKTNPSRLQAMRWLNAHQIKFPHEMPTAIGPDMFFGWRFIRATDGIVYFADCIHEGFTEEDASVFAIQHSNGLV